MLNIVCKKQSDRLCKNNPISRIQNQESKGQGIFMKCERSHGLKKFQLPLNPLMYGRFLDKYLKMS